MGKIAIIFVIISIVIVISIIVGAAEEKKKKINELNARLLKLESKNMEIIDGFTLMMRDLRLAGDIPSDEEVVDLCSLTKDKLNG